MWLINIELITMKIFSDIVRINCKRCKKKKKDKYKIKRD